MYVTYVCNSLYQDGAEATGPMARQYSDSPVNNWLEGLHDPIVCGSSRVGVPTIVV